MRSNKKDIVQFFVWLRNGFAFCTTWFLILMLGYGYMFKQQNISINTLGKMVLLVLGGVLIFNICFTELFIKKWTFTGRLTGFMLALSLYEGMAFYWIGMFAGKGSIVQWLIFAGIVMVLYFLCIGIYKQYSKKKGELYTQALQKYQNERSVTDGK